MNSLLHRLEALTRASSEAVLYTFLDGQGRETDRLSRGELRRRALSVAGRLESHRGRPVMLLLPSGLDFVVCFLGCQYAGCVPVPVMPPRPGRPCEHLQAILQDCTPSLVIAHQDAGLGCPSLTPADAVAGPPAVVSLPAPDDLALLQYTSGSTAHPRGVKVSHANLVHNTGMIQEAFGQPEGCTLVGWLPMSHDMGLIGIVLQTLRVGGHAVLMAPETFLLEPFRWLEAVARYRAHTSGGPNFGYELCLRKIGPERRGTLDLSGWKVAFNGAEPVRERTVRAFTEAFNLAPGTVYPCYGLAEATLFVTGAGQGVPAAVLELDPAALEQGNARPQSGGRSVVSCGTSWGGQHLAIVDPETGEVCEPGRVGEVCLEGPSICRGYWGRDDREGPLRSGDLGFLVDGSLYLVGRCKDLIVLRGRNLHPQDIEATLERAHPAVRPGCCAAFSVEVDDEERLVVVAEVRGEPSEDLRQTLFQAILRHHDVRPHEVLLVPPGSVPKTTSGKVRRGACHRLLPDPLRRFILEQVARALGCAAEAVPTERSFDSLGLDSVARFGLTGELARHLGRSVPGDVTWVHDTVDKLVGYFEHGTRKPEVVCLREGVGLPLFVMHGLHRTLDWCRELVAHLPAGLPVMGLTLHDEPASFKSLEAVATRHVENIRAHQPRGPYRILGYSYGGKLAFEVARQVRELGEEIEFLGVLDGYPRTRQDMPLRERLPFELGRLPALVASRGARGLVSGVLHVGRVLAGSGAPQEPRLSAHLEPVRDYVELAFRYEPRPFEGKLTLLRCLPGEPVHALSARAGGWDLYARGGVEVVELEGTHRSIVREPHVRAVAHHLAARLV